MAEPSPPAVPHPSTEPAESLAEKTASTQVSIENHAPDLQPESPPAVTLATTDADAGAMPRVSPFVLPMDELRQIAESAGLQWINSDTERVAAAQAAIAATPPVPHVPREPKRVVLADEGPLVLVETRRDLKDLVLPFDKATPTN